MIALDTNEIARRIENVLPEISLAGRINRVLAEDSTAPVSPNQHHASFAVLRAARLVSVGNWLAHKMQDRVALLDKQIAKDIKDNFPTSDYYAGDQKLDHLFSLYERDVTACFDCMKGELTDDFQELAAILAAHTSAAVTAHFDAAGSLPKPKDTALPLVLGAPLADHLDKVKSDTLFRLKAETRKAVAAGCTAQETVKRLGLKTDATVTATLASRIENVLLAAIPDQLAAINIGVNLFDATNNSIVKFLQAMVTALATDADGEAGDDVEEKHMGYTWVSAADAKVCPFCEFMDGNQWDENKDPVGDAPELESEPPAHFGCRCSLLPCDLDADLPSGNFQDYLAHYSDTEQKQAFGASNIAAYRRGDLTPAQLMGQQSNEIPLDKFRDMSPVTDFTAKQIELVGQTSRQGILDRRSRNTMAALGLTK